MSRDSKPRRSLTPRRIRVTLFCAAPAAMSGAGTLLRSHPIARVLWLVLMLACFAVAIVEFVKLAKEERP